MPVKDLLLEQKLISCNPSDSILKAAELMHQEDVGAVLVLEDQKPVGIVTDRDIVLRCIAQKTDLNTKVSKVMTKTVNFIKSGAGVQDLILLMRNFKVRRVPVVDDSGRALGLIAYDDIFGLLAKEMSELTSVSQSKEKEAA